MASQKNIDIFDVVVVGGGHGGCEAAAAAARMGMRTLLITFSEKNIGATSCNPSVGGAGRGHLAREIDALDGLLARVADKAATHFRVLNRSKGRAVWGPRVQVDRELFQYYMLQELRAVPTLTLMFAEVEDFIFENDSILGVIVDTNRKIYAAKTILGSGTFLGGMLYFGLRQVIGGRISEKAAHTLAKNVKRIGINTRCFYTDTPQRLDGSTIDYSKMPCQLSDSEVIFMSSLSNMVHAPQLCCYTTKTNKKVHDVALKYISTSVMVNQSRHVVGPRYCPSFEEKLIGYPEEDSHLVWLEREGINNNIVYPNGLFTALSEEAQDEFVRLVPGLENCTILKYGYAVGYYSLDARELNCDLSVRKIKNLYTVGQFNGTSGYEEAASQGCFVGINAALSIQGKPYLPLNRANSYIGLLVDDIRKGVVEPYRTMSCRSEYRLSLRVDNADYRLTEMGIEAGCVGEKRLLLWRSKQKKTRDLQEYMASIMLSPNKWHDILGISIRLDGVKRSLLDIVSYDTVSWSVLAKFFPRLLNVDLDIQNYISSECIYAKYLRMQEKDIEAFYRDENVVIPEDIDYNLVQGISTDSKFQLNLVRPSTLGEASRVSGVTPVAITNLLMYLRKRKS